MKNQMKLEFYDGEYIYIYTFDENGSPYFFPTNIIPVELYEKN